MKIGIIGVGMVGGTISLGFKKIGHEVVEYDVKWPAPFKDILDTELAFICVPTPCKVDGSCDTSVVEKVVGQLSDYHGLAVIKSTVTPGTTDRLKRKHSRLRLAFCPEFLRERTAVSDFIEHHDVLIIGAYNGEDYETVAKAHEDLPEQVVRVTPLEAEFCKYFSNVFNALRIVFANQFYQVCQDAGADYQRVKDAIVRRKNIGNHYLECNRSFREFGGNCLPKDTSAFAAFVKSLGWRSPNLFEQIVSLNERLKVSRYRAWLEKEADVALMEKYNKGELLETKTS